MYDFSIIGWLGAVAFIVAYLLLSLQVLSAERVLYHILNAVGGLCLVINSIFLDDAPNFFVNLIWAAIALFAVYRIQKTSKRKLITDSKD
jgi:hypothetical protein